MMAVTIANTLKQKNTFAIVSHIMPDGDSIGSMLALYSVLSRLKKDVDVFTNDNIPSIYSFLPNFKVIKTCGKSDKLYDVLIVLDCGDIERTGNCSLLSAKSSLTINIDHHGTNTLFANLNLVDTNASATGELIYQIIKLMGIDILKDEAVCIYTSILTDTGSFRYSNTTSITHQIAGDLINTGVDFGLIYNKIYNDFRYEDIKLMGKAIGSLELFNNGRIAYMQLLKNDIDNLSIKEVNTSNFIDYARDINTVEVAVFIKEITTDEYKISLRSKYLVDVKAICEKFGGGGHVKAAGCTIKGNIRNVKNIIIEELQFSLGNDIL